VSGNDDLNVEVIFDDVMVLAAGVQTRWAQRSRIDLAELIDEPWIMTPPNTWSSVILTEAFRARGLEMPKARLTTLSVPLRINLLSTGPYISAFPNSVLYLDPNLVSLKILPVDLPARPWPLAVVTLKNRTLSPIVERFIEHVRAFARSMATRSSATKSA
jgi:DNA-binding transcriptional LysR family regulator